MAIRAQDPVADRAGVVAVDAPDVRPRRMSRSLRQEGWLPYALLTPTSLVILFPVAYPFCTAIYLSLQNKTVVLVENWEAPRALDECHTKIVEIYAGHAKG
jgi:hypothetical protein